MAETIARLVMGACIGAGLAFVGMAAFLGWACDKCERGKR